MILLIITLIISYCYFLLIAFSIKGWKLKNTANSNDQHSYPFCSIVVAARNESIHIKNLCEDLLLQDYPKDCFEIIIIDDHSTDNTFEILQELNSTNENLTILSAPESVTGKKQALKYALSFSHGNFLFFTDADCRIGKEWIKTYMDFANKNKGILYFGNVQPQIQQGILSKFFALDFIGIISVQAGLAKINHAFSCNGANMCITKEFYEKSYSTNSLYTSGDDVFLLHNAKRYDKKQIFLVSDKNAIVETQLPESIPAFINQRCRWASKAGGYKDSDSILVSCIVYATCLMLTFSFIGLCLGSKLCTQSFLFLFLIKLFCDFTIFIQTSSYFKTQKMLWFILPFQCIYFIYITIIPIFAVIFPQRWKTRIFHK